MGTILDRTQSHEYRSIYISIQPISQKSTDPLKMTGVSKLSLQLFSIFALTFYPILASLGNPTKAALGFCETQNILIQTCSTNFKSTANGVARTQLYLTLDTSLLVPRFLPSCVASRGVSQRMDSSCACRQSQTKDLGQLSSRCYQQYLVRPERKPEWG